MSATNKTTHYELPVFVGGDMPAWLTDFNGAMTAIDAGIYQAKTAGDGAQSSADTANANITTLSGTVDGIGGRVTTLEGTVSSQGGNIDTINSLIGNGEPTTTDKTIIGAINELAAEIPGPGQPVDADDVSYDNTTSGLTATDAQAAIDEVAGDVAALDAKVGFPTRLNQGAPQYSPDGGTTWANFSGALSLEEVESAIVTIASGNTGTTGNLSGTQTYTFLNDHAEVLITCQGFLVGYNDVTGGGTATHNISVTGTISGSQTVNVFHDDNEYITGSATVAGPLVKMDRKTYHIEDVKAGDILTLSYATDFTYIRASTAKLEADYVIMTVN